jgi:oligopeptide transport system permease protein
MSDETMDDIRDNAAQPVEASSLWRDAWLRLKANRMAVAGFVFFVFVTLISIIGPEISSYDYDQQDLENTFASPSAEHWFGTDNLGRDLFSRVLSGGRISLAVGFLATAVSLIIGVTYGMTAGYVGGKLDAFMMRFVDILYSLPFVIFVILLMVLFGRNFILLFVAIGAVEWLTMARITRAQTLNLKQSEFVEAAKALGYSNRRILFRHLLPNLLGPVIVYATLTVPAVMLLEAVLSFLGLGVQPPMSSWGSLIKEGSEKMDLYPWLIAFPALFFSLTLFALNFLGDGLRDALDPKASKD